MVQNHRLSHSTCAHYVLGEMVKGGLAVFRDGSVFRSLGVIPDPPCDDITARTVYSHINTFSLST